MTGQEAEEKAPKHLPWGQSTMESAGVTHKSFKLKRTLIAPSAEAVAGPVRSDFRCLTAPPTAPRTLISAGLPPHQRPLLLQRPPFPSPPGFPAAPPSPAPPFPSPRVSSAPARPPPPRAHSPARPAPPFLRQRPQRSPAGRAGTAGCTGHGAQDGEDSPLGIWVRGVTGFPSDETHASSKFLL